MDLKKIYVDCGALLEGHFQLSNGKYSQFYLQSARVLENPHIAQKLLSNVAKQIQDYGVVFDKVCSPALGGVVAGYELARNLNVPFIFTERQKGDMTLRRGFEIKKDEKFIICEDVITTGGSAVEAVHIIESLGGEVVAFCAIANRGICARTHSGITAAPQARLPQNVPFFAIDDFVFELYDTPSETLTTKYGTPKKLGSRGNA